MLPVGQDPAFLKYLYPVIDFTTSKPKQGDITSIENRSMDVRTRVLYEHADEFHYKPENHVRNSVLIYSKGKIDETYGYSHEEILNNPNNGIQHEHLGGKFGLTSNHHDLTHLLKLLFAENNVEQELVEVQNLKDKKKSLNLYWIRNKSLKVYPDRYRQLYRDKETKKEKEKDKKESKGLRLDEKFWTDIYCNRKISVESLEHYKNFGRIDEDVKKQVFVLKKNDINDLFQKLKWAHTAVERVWLLYFDEFAKANQKNYKFKQCNEFFDPHCKYLRRSNVPWLLKIKQPTAETSYDVNGTIQGQKIPIKSADVVPPVSKISKGNIDVDNEEERMNRASIIIQKHLRGHMSRKYNYESPVKKIIWYPGISDHEFTLNIKATIDDIYFRNKTLFNEDEVSMHNLLNGGFNH